jgi:hypothetical protein
MRKGAFAARREYPISINMELTSHVGKKEK